jgi:hypothetical protein
VAKTEEQRERGIKYATSRTKERMVKKKQRADCWKKKTNKHRNGVPASDMLNLTHWKSKRYCVNDGQEEKKKKTIA